MKQPTINQKREAIAMHSGGLGELNDTQVEIVWSSISEETQKQYIDSVKDASEAHDKGKNDAVSTGTKRDVSGNSKKRQE